VNANRSDAARRPRSRRGALGRYGEDLAARWLTEAGMAVLERNWRCRAGEIDIVARDGGAAGALVVCEVKTRRASGYQHPMAGLTSRQAQRLRGLAQRWLSERWLAAQGAPPAGGVRIDLVGVLLPERGAPVVEHAKGVA
jgi:putative endonuclease